MDENTAEFGYVKGQMRESFGALLSSFEQRNAEALALPGWELDIPYGDHHREVMDIRPAGPAACGTLVYFHAGYWQSRDKAQFRFLAPAFNALGWHVALINYPLCPEVSVLRIVESAAKALRQVTSHQARRERGGPMVLCGHSAGAHLAVELALQHTSGGDNSVALAGVIAISGIYDLQPLVQTSLNERLRLDDSQARVCSPVNRACPGAVPALFLVGETETPAFHQQSQAMAQAWEEQGNIAHYEVAPEADHFSVLESITNPRGEIALTLQTW